MLAARAAGLPAYEGYGLSEGGSVQTLNLPGADRPGSVGRPLPHARVEVDARGEIVIGGTLMLGYLGDTRRAAGALAHRRPRASSTPAARCTCAAGSATC